MTDQTFQSKGNVRLRAYAPNAFANPYWPTVAELNLGLRLEDAVTWGDFDFGTQASETNDRAPISAKSNVQSRGAANYGGTIPFDFPGYYNDPSNQLSDIFDFFVPGPGGYDRPACFIVMSVDGEIGEPGQPSADFSFAHGDLLSLYGVRADAWSEMTEGTDPFSYTINFLRNGTLAHYTVASTSTPVLTLSDATETPTVGDTGLLQAFVNGRAYSGGVTWSTTDPDVVTVSEFGAWTAVGAGSADVVATLPNSGGVNENCAFTVTS